MFKRISPPVVIIGAGPAGIACSIQLKRFGLDPLLIEQHHTGGLLHHAHWIENYPGFPAGISGPDLVHLLRRHLKKGRIKVLYDTVQKAVFRNNRFLIKTRQRSILCRTLIIASGTKPRILPKSIVDSAIRDRILYDPRRLRRLRKKTVAIIGAGDAAFDYALGLAPWHRIILLNRGRDPQCLPLLFDRARREPGVRILSRFQVRTIRLVPDGIQINARDGRRVRADYVLPALGRLPSLDFLDPGLRARLRSLKAKRQAWLIGDVHGGRFRQAGISVGEGIRCAMEIADLHRTGSR